MSGMQPTASSQFNWTKLSQAVANVLVKAEDATDIYRNLEEGSNRSFVYYSVQRANLLELQKIINAKDSVSLLKFINEHDPILKIFNARWIKTLLRATSLFRAFQQYHDALFQGLESTWAPEMEARISSIVKHVPYDSLEYRNFIIRAYNSGWLFLFPNLKFKLFNISGLNKSNEYTDAAARIIGDVASRGTLQILGLNKKGISAISNDAFTEWMKSTAGKNSKRWKVKPGMSYSDRALRWWLNLYNEVFFQPIDGVIIVGGVNLPFCNEENNFIKPNLKAYLKKSNNNPILYVSAAYISVYTQQLLKFVPYGVAIAIALVVNVFWGIASLAVILPAAGIARIIYNYREAKLRRTGIGMSEPRLSKISKNLLLLGLYPFMSTVAGAWNIIRNLYKLIVPVLNFNQAIFCFKYRAGDAEIYAPASFRRDNFKVGHVIAEYKDYNNLPNDPLLKMYVRMQQNGQYATLPDTVKAALSNYAYTAFIKYKSMKSTGTDSILFISDEFNHLIKTVRAELTKSNLTKQQMILCHSINRVMSSLATPNTTVATETTSPPLPSRTVSLIMNEGIGTQATQNAAATTGQLVDPAFAAMPEDAKQHVESPEAHAMLIDQVYVDLEQKTLLFANFKSIIPSIMPIFLKAINDEYIKHGYRIERKRTGWETLPKYQNNTKPVLKDLEILYGDTVIAKISEQSKQLVLEINAKNAIERAMALEIFLKLVDKLCTYNDVKIDVDLVVDTGASSLDELNKELNKILARGQFKPTLRVTNYLDDGSESGSSPFFRGVPFSPTATQTSYAPSRAPSVQSTTSPRRPNSADSPTHRTSPNKRGGRPGSANSA